MRPARLGRRVDWNCDAIDTWEERPARVLPYHRRQRDEYVAASPVDYGLAREELRLMTVVFSSRSYGVLTPGIRECWSGRTKNPIGDSLLIGFRWAKGVCVPSVTGRFACSVR